MNDDRKVQSLHVQIEQAALQDAMRSAKSIQDSIKVMSGLEAFYAKTGRIKSWNATLKKN